jgi:hypothetical protein
MRHLFNSRVEIRRMHAQLVNGTPDFQWLRLDQLPTPVLTPPDTLLGVASELMCRLDLNFVRPGKDQPMPVVAGRAPDRMGVAFFDYTDVVKAGDRIVCLSGPVVGTFEIRAIPDPAIGYTSAHHVEVQIIEVAQKTTGRFPGANPQE